MRPVAWLEGDVVEAHALGFHQVDGVVVGTAAQEREEIAHPVGDAEAEHVDVELHHLLRVEHVEGHVPELGGNDALLLEFLPAGAALGEDLDPGSERLAV